MSDSSLIPDQIITGEALYAQAIRLILAKAQHQLLIFDQDLSRGDYASLASYEILKNFLSANIASEIRIVLQNADYFQQKCPRLNSLLKIYQHKMHVHVVGNGLKNIKSCFIVADSMHYIKRMHIDQARFRFAFNEQENVEILRNQFVELEAAAQDNVSVTTLGI